MDIESCKATLLPMLGATVCGVAVGWILRGRFLRVIHREPNATNSKTMFSSRLASGDVPDLSCKLVFVVRNDLKMGKGKLAAQCCHAAVSAYETASEIAPDELASWLFYGQTKVVTKCDSEEELLRLQQHARKLGLVACIIRDAGRTQIAPGSKTVLAVGPGPEDKVNEVTSHLKLL